MILDRLVVNQVGGLRGPVEIQPCGLGVHVLAAPNEAGKSTLIRSLTRSLFDKHTTQAEEIARLRPAGSRLAPKIEVEFTVQSDRWRLEKQFLERPAARLFAWRGEDWKLTAEADAADDEVRRLLQTSLPGRGASKAEHWGLFQHLWARQGEPASWPKLEGEAGQKLRHHLAGVEIDPAIRGMLARLENVAAESLTPTGEIKTGGPLKTAERELETLRTQLGEVQQHRQTLERLEREFAQAEETVHARESEHRELEERNRAWTVESAEAEKQIQELRLAEQQHDAAKENAERLRKNLERGEAAKAGLAEAKLATKQAKARLAEMERNAEKCQQDQRMIEERLAAARKELANLRDAATQAQTRWRTRRWIEEADHLRRQTQRASTLAAQIENWERQLNGLPALSEKEVDRLQKKAAELDRLEAQLAVAGIQLEFIADAATQVRLIEQGKAREHQLSPDAPKRDHAGAQVEMELAGWGRIAVRCGASELQDLAAAAERAREALHSAFAAQGVASITAARLILERRREIDHELKEARAVLREALGGRNSLAALQSEASEAEARASGATEDLRDKSLAELESAAMQAAALEADVQRHVDRLEEESVEKRRSLAAVFEARAAAKTDAAEKSTRTTHLAERLLEIESTLPTDREAAQAEAANTVFLAQGRIAAARQKLPVDHDKLSERLQRSTKALTAVQDALRTARSRRDELRGQLISHGSDGLYAKETALLEQEIAVVAQRDRARRRAWAARLVHALLSRRQRQQVAAVLAPLEAELSAAFRQITGDATRRVFLDENLRLAGVGFSREEAVDFDDLSQGAKEQLLLCLRLALAKKLAEDEPQLLILDDVLVNTDAARQQRVLDFLENAGARLQILILTCHPDRYRGAGRELAFAVAG